MWDNNFVCSDALAPIHTGGKLVYQYQKKPVKAPRCGDCGNTLHGVSCRIGMQWEFWTACSWVLCDDRLRLCVPASWPLFPRLKRPSAVPMVVPAALTVSATALSVLSLLRNKRLSRRSSKLRPKLKRNNKSSFGCRLQPVSCLGAINIHEQAVAFPFGTSVTVMYG